MKKIKFKTKPQEKKVNLKKGRLIVRNLPFSVTEEALKNHFNPYGEVKDVSILRKADGKLVGCGFVQFNLKQNAAKAIHHTSGKPLLGRTIIVDWAVPKVKFAQPCEETQFTNTAVKDKPNESLDDEASVEDELVSNCEVSSEDESEPDNEELDYIPIASEDDRNIEKSKPKPSHDVGEGKTVFLKHVPFNITNDELRAFMVEQIGPVYFAVVCMDPLTEHSKGTAFVKFKEKRHAEECLNAGSRLKFKGILMEALPALDKNNLANRDRDRHPDKKRDNRSLYLVKEGVVIAGTKAAIGVSMSDMKKRLELEVWKSSILRNLNMFISRTRLIVHNLPSNYDDKMLRELFKKHSPPKSRITEAKVMRNFRQLDKDGKPISKGYGFVSFSQHESALSALRAINNSPDIFNKNKRPIVAFSIENRAVIAVKQKRMEKSKLHNSTCPESKKPKNENPKKKKFEGRVKKPARSDNVPTFAGMESHPGHTKLPSKRKILSQNEVHMQTVKTANKNSKRKKQILEVRKEKAREPKVKSKPKNKNFDEKHFNSLVAKYKERILPTASLKKWYENE